MNPDERVLDHSDAYQKYITQSFEYSRILMQIIGTDSTLHLLYNSMLVSQVQTRSISEWCEVICNYHCSNIQLLKLLLKL